MRKVRQAIIKHLWWVIAVVACALLLCHSLQIATITVDATSLILLALILLSPFIAAVKRLKIGDFEAEIEPAEVKRLVEQVTNEVPVVENPKAAVSEEPFSAGAAIRELAENDVVVALAKLRIELERTIQRLYSRSHGGQSQPRTLSLRQVVGDLAARQVVPGNLASPIIEVLALCNRAIHGEAIRDRDARSVIESGVELLQAVEQLNREFGVAHPVEKVTISGAEVENYRTSRFRVTTVIPLVDSPQRVTYNFTHEELENFLDGYAEFAEFVVAVEKLA
jgi:hypothetical protein